MSEMPFDSSKYGMNMVLFECLDRLLHYHIRGSCVAFSIESSKDGVRVAACSFPLQCKWCRDIIPIILLKSLYVSMKGCIRNYGDCREELVNDGTSVHTYIPIGKRQTAVCM